MRTRLLQLGPITLAVLLLARGPFCGLLCEAPAFEGPAEAMAQHGASSMPCHGDASEEAPAAPSGSHESGSHDCAGCDELALKAAPPAADAKTLQPPTLAGTSGNVALRMAARRATPLHLPGARPPPTRDLRLQHSSFLL